MSTSSLFPTVSKRAFLIPGVWGDEPQLMDLRQALTGHIDLEVVDLPDVGAPGAVITSMQGTARFVADQIARRQPIGPLSIAGYSFGASAALETACELVRRGRVIEFLGILDGPLRLEEIRQIYALLASITRSAPVKEILLGTASAVDIAQRLAQAATSREPSSTTPSEAVRRAVLTYLRSKAVNSWHPSECLAKGVHVFTGTYGDANRQRWAALCPNLVPLRVETEHTAILKGTFLDVVSRAFHAAAIA